jgi:hypothetical protein
MSIDALDDLISAAFAPVPVAFEIPRLSSWPTVRRERPFKQRDVVRALRAAKAAGVTARIEIAPDGKISLVPMTLVEAAPDSDDAILARLQ